MFAVTPSAANRGHVRRVHDLQVGDVVPAAAGPVRGAGGLNGVQRLAHRPVADGVQVHLEAGRVQPGDLLAQHVRRST